MIQRFVPYVGAIAVVVTGVAASIWSDELIRGPPSWSSPVDWLWVRWIFSVVLALSVGVVFAVIARRHCPGRTLLAWSPLAFLLIVVALPPMVGLGRALSTDPTPLPHANLQGVTRLDVLIIARRTVPRLFAVPPPPLDQTPWNTRWSAVVLGGKNVRVVLDGASSREAVIAALTGARDDQARRPQWRAGARHIVVLDPYPTPAIVSGGGLSVPNDRAPAKPGRLARRAAALTPSSAQVFVLLHSGESEQVLQRWRSWAVRNKGGVLLTGQRGAETLADVGWRAAVTGALSTDYASLAWRFRPQLLFHSSAPEREAGVFAPINVDEFFATRRPWLCRTGGITETCTRIMVASQIDGSYDYLDAGATQANPDASVAQGGGGSLSTSVGSAGLPPGVPLPPDALPPPEPSSPSSAGDACSALPAGIPPPPPCVMASPIYWFARRHASEIYVGYWWFFPFNRSPVFRHSTCNPSAGIPEVTCFDHASDWEGVTVVVPIESTHPSAVIYEQHGAMVRFDWPGLDQAWGTRPSPERPLVFVAAGSHASYPFPCLGPAVQPERVVQLCDQQPRSKLPDGPHDGEIPWPNNDDARCQWVCLLRLPTANRKPALWNAFPGRWGRRVCILGDSLCTQTSGPRSPGSTDRFKRPWTAKHYEYTDALPQWSP